MHINILPDFSEPPIFDINFAVPPSKIADIDKFRSAIAMKVRMIFAIGGEMQNGTKQVQIKGRC